MAKARVNKKMGPMVELPECPICLETMSAPIFQCQSGHSICDPCNKTLIPRLCPICRQQMTQTRNWQLEQLIGTAPINCPNKASGCNFRTGSNKMENHLKECIFRVMTCPVGIFGGCHWSGVLKEMLDHVTNSHQQNVLMNLYQEVTINCVSVTQNSYFVYIVPQGKMIFILTLQIDISEQLVYWLVQLVGCQKVAQQYIYEINISSLQDNRRQVTYSEHCFSDAVGTAEIFRQAKCCVMPLSLFDQFIQKNKVTFNLNVKKNQPVFTKEPNTDAQQSNQNFVTRSSRYRGKSPSPMYWYPSASGRKSRNDE